MKHLFGHYRPYIPHILLVILVLFGQVLAELALPGLMARIIDRGIIPGNLSFIYQTGALMLAATCPPGLLPGLPGPSGWPFFLR